MRRSLPCCDAQHPSRRDLVAGSPLRPRPAANSQERGSERLLAHRGFSLRDIQRSTRTRVEGGQEIVANKGDHNIVASQIGKISEAINPFRLRSQAPLSPTLVKVEGDIYCTIQTLGAIYTEFD